LIQTHPEIDKSILNTFKNAEQPVYSTKRLIERDNYKIILDDEHFLIIPFYL
jgi:hypothetical protein